MPFTSLHDPWSTRPATPRCRRSSSRLLALLVMLASAHAAPVPARGGLMLRGPAGTAPVEAVQLATDIGVDVSGPTARAVVTQAFRNTTADWVEGTYVYPLPEDAAVDGMKLVVGNRVIVADIRERAAAKRAYEAAKAAGQAAALTEQERPNIFTNAVANIGPGETVLVQITYQQTIPVSGDDADAAPAPGGRAALQLLPPGFGGRVALDGVDRPRPGTGSRPDQPAGARSGGRPGRPIRLPSPCGFRRASPSARCAA